MLPCDWLSRVDPLGSCPTREGQSSRRQLYYVIFTLSQVCCITQWQVCRFTLKCTWMWSRRTSTRKNLRPQISQVYFLSPWVNRCLFMLLLQENTCARTHTHIYIEYMWSPVCVLLFDPLTQEIRNLVQITHLTTDGTRWRLLPVLGGFFSIDFQLLSFHVLCSCTGALWDNLSTGWGTSHRLVLAELMSVILLSSNHYSAR